MRFIFPFFKRAVLSIFINEGISIELIESELKLLNTEINSINNNINKINNNINTIIDRLFYQKYLINKKMVNIAVFGVMPPEKSGIAIYNKKTFGINDNFHVFSRFMSTDNCEITKENFKENYNDNFFPINFFSNAKAIFNYSKIIFVLGNSFHNIPYLDAAIKEKYKKYSYLYCHEVFFHDLLRAYFDFPIYKNVLCNAYPELIQEINNYNIESFENIKSLCYGIRAILLLTGISNVIVNNNIAKEKLLDDIKGTVFENNIRIIVLFLPIPNLKSNIYKEPNLSYINEIKIGVFGICDNKYKSTNVILNAIVILNELYNLKSKCIIAGYDVDSYVKTINSESIKMYLVWFSNVSDKQIESLMSQVDIAVQLRNYPQGETSAVICQLLGLNKNIIVSEKFIDSDLEEYCTVVKKFISAEELAEKLYEIFSKKQRIIDNNKLSKLIEGMSFEKLADTILRL